jgi:hypothetical protein
MAASPASANILFPVEETSPARGHKVVLVIDLDQLQDNFTEPFLLHLCFVFFCSNISVLLIFDNFGFSLFQLYSALQTSISDLFYVDDFHDHFFILSLHSLLPLPPGYVKRDPVDISEHPSLHRLPVPKVVAHRFPTFKTPLEALSHRAHNPLLQSLLASYDESFLQAIFCVFQSFKLVPGLTNRLSQVIPITNLLSLLSLLLLYCYRPIVVMPELKSLTFIDLIEPLDQTS